MHLGPFLSKPSRGGQAPIRRAPLSSGNSCLKHFFWLVEGQGTLESQNDEMVLN